MDFGSMITGAVISGAIGGVFYWLGGRVLRKYVEDLSRQNALLRRSVGALGRALEAQGIVHLTYDPETGELIDVQMLQGIGVQATGIGTGLLTQGPPPTYDRQGEQPDSDE